MLPIPDAPMPGQESVWDYPRPAIMRASARHVRIVHRGVVLADTKAAIETLETSHPPSYYLPVGDILPGALRPVSQRSICEWKGQARYFDVLVAGVRMASMAWCYDRPTPEFAGLVGHVAFYAAPFEGCFVDGEKVVPQPGGFYGGWVTSHVSGPFKGGPGSQFW